MPYVFVEIEKQKKRVIGVVFVFLAILYFFIAELLWLVTKIFFFLQFEFRLTSPARLFSPGELFTVFLIALAVAAIHWYFSTQNMIVRLLNLLGASEPDAKDSYHQVFKNVVEEVCVATGGAQIRPYAIPSPALNAFAISDTAGNAVIGVTEGLLARLNRAQLEAVVGHEAAHIVSGDSLTTTITCSLFAVYSALLEKISKILSSRGKGRGGARVVAYLAVIYAVLSITQFVNLLLNMFLSRQKEYRADAAAVRLTRNPVSLAEALYIISRGWRGVGGIPASLAPLFIMSPEYSNLEEKEGFVSDLFSTHPPVSSRLTVLLGMAHCDIAALKAGIRPKEKISVQDGLIELKEAPAPKWLVYKDNSWSAPFSAEELLRLGLTPDSWVSRLGEDFVKPALDDLDLNKAFREGPLTVSGPRVCPECRQPLAETLYEGAPVLKCTHCSGFFAPAGAISRVIIREDFSFDQTVKESAEELLKSYSKNLPKGYFKVKYALTCPRCNEKMWRGFFSYAFPVEVDKCWKCRYLWFNKGELEALQYLSEKFRQAKT